MGRGGGEKGEVGKDGEESATLFIFITSNLSLLYWVKLLGIAPEI